MMEEVPDSLVWDQGGPKKARKLDMRDNIDLESLPGPPGFLGGPWIQVQGGGISGAAIAAWPYSVGILCKFTPSLLPCIDQGVLVTWAIWASLFWKFSSFSSNGLVIVW